MLWRSTFPTLKTDLVLKDKDEDWDSEPNIISDSFGNAIDMKNLHESVMTGKKLDLTPTPTPQQTRSYSTYRKSVCDETFSEWNRNRGGPNSGFSMTEYLRNHERTHEIERNERINREERAEKERLEAQKEYMKRFLAEKERNHQENLNQYNF